MKLKPLKIGGGGGGEKHFHLGSVRDVLTFRASIFSKNSRVGCKISVKMPGQGYQKP